MSNRLLREPDVIKAILENKEMFRTGRDIQRFAVIVGSIPAVDVELNLKLAYERGKSDRPQGEWERRLVDNGFNADWVCSECGYRVKTDFVSFNFCPNCGCRMKGADDEQ